MGQIYIKEDDILSALVTLLPIDAQVEAVPDKKGGHTLHYPDALKDEVEAILASDPVKTAKLKRDRIKRNALLKETDWTQIPDVSLAPEKRAEWALYRQKLRDLDLEGAEAIKPKD
jgi:hypothetical protein